MNYSSEWSDSILCMQTAAEQLPPSCLEQTLLLLLTISSLQAAVKFCKSVNWLSEFLPLITVQYDKHHETFLSFWYRTHSQCPASFTLPTFSHWRLCLQWLTALRPTARQRWSTAQLNKTSQNLSRKKDDVQPKMEQTLHLVSTHVHTYVVLLSNWSQITQVRWSVKAQVMALWFQRRVFTSRS